MHLPRSLVSNANVNTVLTKIALKRKVLWCKCFPFPETYSVSVRVHTYIEINFTKLGLQKFAEAKCSTELNFIGLCENISKLLQLLKTFLTQLSIPFPVSAGDTST
jgi:hypothetical protein